MRFCLLIIQLLLLWPGEALALQGHGGPEGLYLHLAAHIIFFVAMVSLAVWIRRSRLEPSGPWRLMAWGAVLMACWNLWAFTGHLLAGTITRGSPSPFDSGQGGCLRVEGWRCLLLYILKLDHLLSFPAILLFYLGLRRMGRREGGGP